MILHRRQSILLLVAMLFALLLSSCTAGSKEGEPGAPAKDEGTPVEVSISLTSRSMLSPTTRADGHPADPDDINEKIKDWFLVFVDRNGKVSKILNRNQAQTSGVAPLEQETFKCIIPAGTYSVFAFANITPNELNSASGVAFTEGKTLTADELSAVKSAVWKGLGDTDGHKDSASSAVSHGGNVTDAKVTSVSNSNLNLWDITKKAIPMTGYLPSVKIENRVEESFSIEVVRMLAKADLMISNNTNKQVRVNGVGLDPVTVTPVSLFPNGAAGISYGFLGNEAFTPVAGAEYARLMYTPAAPWTVKANTAQNEAVRCRFYFKESLSLRENGGLFTIWLDVTHDDGDRNVVQYNVTSDIRNYINRNDWLVIPVVLSQYAVQVDAIFYPPIGGYPAYLSAKNPDGSQVFTFGTQGEFCIVPHVIDKETGEHLSPSLYRFAIDAIQDPDKIFKKNPYISETASSLPDEILGTLNTNQGKAYVTIKVMVYDSPNDTQPTQTYLRTIHIVRDNNAVPQN